MAWRGRKKEDEEEKDKERENEEGGIGEKAQAKQKERVRGEERDVPLPSVLPLNEDSHFSVEKERLLSVWVCNVPDVSSDMLAAPYAHFADGSMDVLSLKPGSVMQTLKALGKLEKGEHVHLRGVDYRKVKRMTLVLEDYGSPVDIDGELYEISANEQIVMESHPGICQLFVRG